MAGKSFFTITINQQELAKNFAILAGLAIRLSDLTEPLTAIVNDFYRVEADWFDSEGGGRWRALSPRYAAWKNKHYPGRRILHLTRTMRDEFTGASQRYRITKNSVVVSQQNADYWIAHEEGSWRLPQREVISPMVYQRVDTWGDWIYEFLIGSVLGKRRPEIGTQ